jgi:deferrochelatase/peroxidase EfeB
VAAKLMGRWRSGAPLVLAPDKDDPVLGADPQQNNDFNYKHMDPFGYAVPLGAHIRRMNPRDTAADDAPWSHLRPASSGRRTGGRRGAGHRRVRDLRKPHSPV